MAYCKSTPHRMIHSILFLSFQKPRKKDCHQRKQYLAHTKQLQKRLDLKPIKDLRRHKLKAHKRNTEHQIIWFHSPYNKNVTSNMAKPFLSLVDKDFFNSNKLHKIFNRKTVKVSYSCTDNIRSIIKSNNKKVTKTSVRYHPLCRVKMNA